MAQYGFYFDGTRCTGCKTCEMACKDYKDLSVGFAYRKVYEVTLGSTTKDAAGSITTTCISYPFSMACNHCDHPACAKVCPTGAMHKDANTGLVSVDAHRCVGCGYCHMACPYNAPKVDRSKGHSVKCDGCQERVSSGEKPICVEACPARALDFGLTQDMAQKGQRAAIAPLPEPHYTTPNMYVKASEDAQPVGSSTAKVVNPLEVM